MSSTKPKKSNSRSAKAGLTLPIARINRSLKAKASTKRVAATAPVFLTAALEYCTAELLELAGRQALSRNKKTLTPEDLIQGIRKDSDLSKLFKTQTIYIGEKPRNAALAIAMQQKPVKA